MNEEKRGALKAVLDTNTLLSALLWYQGNPRLIFRKAIEGSLKIFCCEAIIDELREVLERDFEEDENIINQQISVILTYAELVELSFDDRVVMEDPDDDVIVNCALSSRADFIVTGDNHLLKLKEYKGIKIINSSDFLKLL